MWRTFTGFPLLMLLLIKHTIPLTVYVLDIKFWRLSFLQLYAILLFTGVTFSFINKSLVRPNVDLSIDFSFFLLESACLANFLLEKRTIVFWNYFGFSQFYDKRRCHMILR